MIESEFLTDEERKAMRKILRKLMFKEAKMYCEKKVEVKSKQCQWPEQCCSGHCDETSVIEGGNFLVNHYLAYSTSEIQQMTLAQLIAENYEGNLVDIWTKNKLKMKMKLEKVLRSQKLFVILQPIIVKEVEVLVSNIDLTIKSFEAKVDEGGDGAGAAEDNLLFEDDELLGQPLGTIMPQIDIENTLESKVSNFLIQSIEVS